MSCQLRASLRWQASSRVRTKEVNKVRKQFVKDIEVKREVCFAPLVWMSAFAGMTVPELIFVRRP